MVVSIRCTSVVTPRPSKNLHTRSRFQWLPWEQHDEDVDRANDGANGPGESTGANAKKPRMRLKFVSGGRELQPQMLPPESSDPRRSGLGQGNEEGDGDRTVGTNTDDV